MLLGLGFPPSLPRTPRNTHSGTCGVKNPTLLWTSASLATDSSGDFQTVLPIWGCTQVECCQLWGSGLPSQPSAEALSVSTGSPVLFLLHFSPNLQK